MSPCSTPLQKGYVHLGQAPTAQSSLTSNASRDDHPLHFWAPVPCLTTLIINILFLISSLNLNLNWTECVWMNLLLCAAGMENVSQNQSLLRTEQTQDASCRLIKFCLCVSCLWYDYHFLLPVYNYLLDHGKFLRVLFLKSNYLILNWIANTRFCTSDGATLALYKDLGMRRWREQHHRKNSHFKSNNLVLLPNDPIDKVKTGFWNLKKLLLF